MKTIFLAAVFCAFTSVIAAADSATIVEGVYYSQTSNTTISPLLDAFLQANFSTSSTFSNVTVTSPGTASPLLLQDQFNSWQGVDVFNSVFALNQADPAGPYTFYASGITPETLTVTLSGSLPVEPIFTGTSFTDLSNDDPNMPITLTFNGLPANSGDDLFLGLTDLTNTAQDVLLNSASPATQFTLAPGTLISGHPYELSLEYYIPNTDSIYESATFISFTAAPAPEPSIFVYMSASLGGLLLLRQARRRMTAFIRR